MADNIKELYEKLQSIRTYLIKIGPSRRCGDIIDKKFRESEKLKQNYDSLLDQLVDNVTQGLITNADEIKKIEELGNCFEKLFNEVRELCKIESLTLTMSKTEGTSSTMAKFDIKVAMNLLPVMTDDEVDIKQLIDKIEYYSTIIEAQSHCDLINFILKSRLSASAKLRLDESYNNISELLQDMKRELLPKKSVTAIQSKLLTIKQNRSTVTDYGKQITELFVDLTISQSNGDSKAYKFLKPLNEKQAIRRFADGLRDRRLSTIILARNYDNLKDAIQAAVDEEVQTSSPGDVLVMNRSNHFSRNYRGSRGYRGYNRGSYDQNQSRGNYSYQRGVGRPQGHQQSATPMRGRGPFQSRGRMPNFRNFRGKPRTFHQQNHNINYTATSNDLTSESTEINTTQSTNLDSTQFFRS